mmetsp:Transcript_29158/g.68743  ORF Transcript_29158/g.68743 Transcript_29158/m.68743 type:complete len:245 (+) Transcript_29158:594-1328(+)
MRRASRITTSESTNRPSCRKRARTSWRSTGSRTPTGVEERAQAGGPTGRRWIRCTSDGRSQPHRKTTLETVTQRTTPGATATSSATLDVTSFLLPSRAAKPEAGERRIPKEAEAIPTPSRWKCLCKQALLQRRHPREEPRRRSQNRLSKHCFPLWKLWASSVRLPAMDRAAGLQAASAPYGELCAQFWRRTTKKTETRCSYPSCRGSMPQRWKTWRACAFTCMTALVIPAQQSTASTGLPWSGY